jgi:hypothetical protein
MDKMCIVAMILAAPRIQELCLDACSDLEDDDFRPLIECKDLRRVSLSWCTNLTPKALKNLSGIKTLTSVDFTGNCQFKTTLSVTYFPGAKDIYKRSQHMRVSGPLHRLIMDNSHLTDLVFNRTSVDDNVLNTMSQCLSKIRLLHVGSTHVSDEGLSAIFAVGEYLEEGA